MQGERPPSGHVTREQWVLMNALEPVLDLGCGDSVYFDETVDYVGVDVDAESPDVVRSLPEQFVLGDATRAPVKADSFRTVVLAEILEHLEHPPAAIAEARRIATERILITVPDEARWQPAAKPGQHEDHERVYSDDLLLQHLLRGGITHGNADIGHIQQPPFAFWVAMATVGD